MSPVLQYGLTWGDFIFLTGFTHAVIMAMLHSKTKAIHARYLIASAIWALLPALARLIYYPLVIGFGFPPPLSFIQVVYISVALVVVALGIMMALDYRDERKVYTSYGIAAGGALLFAATLQTMGSATWWIAFCDRLLT